VLASQDPAQWLMNQGCAVFSQLISFLRDRAFRRCVERYQGDSRMRGFFCWDQYLSMAFAQLTYRKKFAQFDDHRSVSIAVPVGEVRQRKAAPRSR
jgi:hypothetical protein